MSDRIPVAVLGAGGLVGQHLVRLLDDHPWFDLQMLVGRPGAPPRPLGELWRISPQAPKGRAAERIRARTPAAIARAGVGIAFSALPSGSAAPTERELGRRGVRVFTNAADLRLDRAVPLVVPEVNGSRPEVRRAVLRAPIVANPNCTTTGLALAVAPVWEALEPRRLHLHSYQALSGAGFAGWDDPRLRGTVVPHIPGEEEKVVRETARLFPARAPSPRRRGPTTILAQCARVPVLDGHLEAITVEAGRRPTAGRLRAAWTRFDPLADARLPTAPRPPLHLRPEPDRPQPLRDLDAGGTARSRGMAVTIGRIRWTPPFLRMVALVHNAIRGAAGAAVLNAEWAEQLRSAAARGRSRP